MAGHEDSQVPDYFKFVNYGDLQMMLRTWEGIGRATESALAEKDIKRFNTRHCASFQYPGSDRIIGAQTEIVGHLPVLAERVAQTINDGRTFFYAVGKAAVDVSAQDVIVHGFDVDGILGGFAFREYAWGKKDPKRLYEFARGIRDGCLEIKSAYPCGETASVPFIINPLPPVTDAPVLFTTALGSTHSSGLIVGDTVEAGDVILGALATNIHVNGPSGIMDLPGFPGILLDRLSDGTLFGEALMEPMRCYLQLVRALKAAGIPIRAMMAGSGGGVSKLAFDERQFTYQIQHWPEPPLVFKKIMELIKQKPNLPRAAYSFLKQFNAGIGWFVFVSPEFEKLAIEASNLTSTPLMKLGVVKEGKRGTMFEPDSDTWLAYVPPEERWLEPQEA